MNSYSITCFSPVKLIGPVWDEVATRRREARRRTAVINFNTVWQLLYTQARANSKSFYFHSMKKYVVHMFRNSYFLMKGEI